MITLDTKLIGLLGYPLKHSFSAKMHNNAFKNMNLDYIYLPIEVEDENLGDVVKGMKHMNFVGFNITKPHKLRIIKYLDEIDDLAVKIGSVNTVRIVDGKLIGYNTDGEGYVESLKQKLEFEPQGKRITIIGAGGAARAVAFTLANYGPEQINILNRTTEIAKKLSLEINKNANSCTRYLPLDTGNLKIALDNSDIVINATGLGMYPYTDKTPLDKELLNNDLIVSDLIYNPLKSRLLKEAEEIGCKTINGLGMFINQGAKAFELWTKVKAPIKEMNNIVNDIIYNLDK